jgi:hypothetical protein
MDAQRRDDSEREDVRRSDDRALIEHFHGPVLTILEFGRDGRSGPPVSVIGVTFEAALANGRDWLRAGL